MRVLCVFLGVVFGLVLGVLVCGCGTSLDEGEPRVRVVLITLDTLRFDRFEANRAGDSRRGGG